MADLPDSLNVRECTVCKAVKPLVAFPKNKKCEDGRVRQCRDCVNTRARGHRTRWENENPDFLRRRYESQLKARAKKYGITYARLVELLARDKCDVCGGGPSGLKGSAGRFHVDHCHLIGDVRGVLCGNCNVAIGLFKDNPETLRSAAAYLERSRDA